MQAIQHEGDGSPKPGHTTETIRFRRDTETITLTAPGWKSGIGTCSSIQITAVKTDGVLWDCVRVPVLYLYPAAALLALQGALLQTLFPIGAQFSLREAGFYTGSFALLKAHVPSFASSPVRLEKLVLARLAPKDFNAEVLRSIVSTLSA